MDFQRRRHKDLLCSTIQDKVVTGGNEGKRTVQSYPTDKLETRSMSDNMRLISLSTTRRDKCVIF